LFDYNASESIDISFKKGDRMEVIDDSEADWWRVKHLTTKEKGLIPKTFVGEEGTIYCEE
jgi:hypothetical protein